MKKSVSVALTVLILLTAVLSANAAFSENRVYSDAVTVEKGSTVMIPIKIENNTGIMGFAIDISYDPDILTPISVTGTDVLSGTINDSIEPESTTSGSFRVLYTGTENFTSDGTMFILEFTVSDTADGTLSVGLSYSDEDTFNESFEEVTLNCENVSVTVNSTGDDPAEDVRLSVRIKNWAAGLKSPWNTIMSIIVAPVVFVLQLFGR